MNNENGKVYYDILGIPARMEKEMQGHLFSDQSKEDFLLLTTGATKMLEEMFLSGDYNEKVLNKNIKDVKKNLFMSLGLFECFEDLNDVNKEQSILDYLKEEMFVYKEELLNNVENELFSVDAQTSYIKNIYQAIELLQKVVLTTDSKKDIENAIVDMKNLLSRDLQHYKNAEILMKKAGLSFEEAIAETYLVEDTSYF